MIPHLRADKPGAAAGERYRPHNPRFWQGNKASKPLASEVCGGCSSRINFQPHGRVHWRDPQSPRACTNHPPGNQHQRGPICLWVAGKVSEDGLRAKWAALFLLGTLPNAQHHNTAMGVALPWRIPKALPLTV